MVGFIYFAVIGVGLLIHFINENKENEENKKRYRHPNGLTYIDNKGRSRLLSNDKLVFYTHDKNGDYILEDVSGHVYRNFSEEKRVKWLNDEKKRAIENKESTYCLDDNNHRKDWTCKGKRFVDLKTGNIYVIRYIKYKYYYMDISTGLLVRKTDWQIKKDDLQQGCRLHLDNNLNVEAFNERQRLVQDRHMLFRDFEYNSSCDYYK